MQGIVYNRIMRQLFKYILVLLSRFGSFIYTYDISLNLKRKKDLFFTLWVSNIIGSIGQDSRIYFPCQFWGGGQKNIFIGDNTTIQSYCVLGCWVKYAGEEFSPSIKIGDNCNIGEHTHISAINKIFIGNGLLTGRYVYIGDNSHGGFSKEEAETPPINRKLVTKGEIVIDDNVWIGDKVTILSGVKIGKGSIIGANAVVTKDVPPYTVVGGNPARIIKQLEICQNQEL